MEADKKNVVILGHCGYDGPRIEKIVHDLGYGATQLATEQEFEDYLGKGNHVELVLPNRIFLQDSAEGIEFIAHLKEKHPQIKAMLVSNYEEAQLAAIDKGALQGFGKQALDAEETKQKIKDALESQGSNQ